MQSPLVSIIMPAYNSAAFIAESIKSVQAQSIENWELLIIDDASTDDTLNIIKEFKEEDQRIQYYNLPANQGTGFARNIGIKASRGKYISFLDSDDLWKPHKLRIQLELLEGTGAEVCFSSYELIDPEGISLDIQVLALEHLSFKKLLKANYVGNLTGIYNSEHLGKFYAPAIRKRQDWAMWLEIIKKAGSAKGISEPLACYRVRKDSISGDKMEMVQYNFNVYRKALGYSFFKSSFLFSLFLFEQFFIKSRQRVSLKK